MEKEELNESNKNNCSIFHLDWKTPEGRCKMILLLISMLLSSAIMIIANQITYDGEISKSISDELIDNFESGFFMSFRNDETDASKVKFGKWQGTLKGCGVIEDGVKQAKILEEGKKCKEGEYIKEIPSQDITSYKGLSLSASTKGKYYDLLYDGSIVNNAKDCPEGKKSCGYVDTLKNIYCLDKNAECPISYIKIQSSPPTGVEGLITVQGSKTNLYYSNTPSFGPLDFPYIFNSFKIADSVLCALPNLYYSSIPLHNLDAFVNKFSKNCVLKDYSQKVTVDMLRYFSLSEIDNYDLYEENNIIEKIKNSKLIDYGFNVDNYKNNKLNLYIRAHFGFNKTCLDQMGFIPDHLVYIYGMADNMILYGQWSYLTILTIFTSFTNFFSITSACDCSKKYTSFETLIKSIINIGSSLYLLVYSFYAIDYDDFYEKEMNCSDVITNNNYNIMIYKLKKNGKYIKWNFFLYFALFLSFFLYGIVLLIFRQNKKGWPCSKKKTKKDDIPKQDQGKESVEMGVQGSLLPNKDENEIKNSENNHIDNE